MSYQTQRTLDLTEPPLSADRTSWTDPCDYTVTQGLVLQARRADVEAIRYESVRDPRRAANIALLNCELFNHPRPLAEQTWYLFLGEVEASWRRAHGTRAERASFKVESFDLCQ